MKHSVITLLLLTAAALSLLVWDLEAEGGWPYEALTVLAVVAVNAVLAVLQEGRAERSLHALRALTPLSTLVLREGAVLSAPAAELVPGDVLLLEEGQAVPAEVLGVNAVAFVLNLAGSNLRHSHLWISFGPLEWLLMSPAQHQLHHSLETSGHGVNYGSFLSLWDVLARTFQRATKRPVRQHAGTGAINAAKNANGKTSANAR